MSCLRVGGAWGCQGQRCLGQAESKGLTGREGSALGFVDGQDP